MFVSVQLWGVPCRGVVPTRTGITLAMCVLGNSGIFKNIMNIIAQNRSAFSIKMNQLYGKWSTKVTKGRLPVIVATAMVSWTICYLFSLRALSDNAKHFHL